MLDRPASGGFDVFYQDYVTKGYFIPPYVAFADSLGMLGTSLKAQWFLWILKNKKIKIATFSRNFGHMSAVNAGLILSQGEKVVIMDADLQDPPEVIEKMWKKAKEGYQVVYGIKEKRKESFIKRFLFDAFYRILNNISSYKMPLDAGTFSLIDRKIINI